MSKISCPKCGTVIHLTKKETAAIDDAAHMVVNEFDKVCWLSVSEGILNKVFQSIKCDHDFKWIEA